MFDSDEQHLNGCPFLPQYNYNSAQFSDQKTMCQLQCCNMLQCNRRFWMLPIMSEMKMGRFRTWHNLAQLGSCCLQCLALPLAPWRPEVLKDGAAVPAPGAGDALVLQISCNEVQTNGSSRTRTKDEIRWERRWKEISLVDAMKVDIEWLKDS